MSDAGSPSPAPAPDAVAPPKKVEAEVEADAAADGAAPPPASAPPPKRLTKPDDAAMKAACDDLAAVIAANKRTIAGAKAALDARAEKKKAGGSPAVQAARAKLDGLREAWKAELAAKQAARAELDAGKAARDAARSAAREGRAKLPYATPAAVDARMAELEVGEEEGEGRGGGADVTAPLGARAAALPCVGARRPLPARHAVSRRAADFGCRGLGRAAAVGRGRGAPALDRGAADARTAWRAPSAPVDACLRRGARGDATKGRSRPPAASRPFPPLGEQP